ncbi:uncharacterized protein LOC144100872 isoform X1 [Amblyomma americanum]
MNVLQAMLVATVGTLVGTKKLFCEECWYPNQEKAKCASTYLAEDTCPGVPFIECKFGYCKCHCIPGFYRRWDFQCVPERQCYPRQLRPEQWFRSTDDIYQKFMSGYMTRLYPFSCFKSKYKRQSGNIYFRSVQFLMKNRTGKISRSYDLQLKLRYSARGDEAYIDVAAEGRGKRPPDYKPTYSILYASDNCILIGDEYPGPGRFTNCTLWTTLNRIENLHWSCEYMFELNCKQPNLTVSRIADCWRV